MQNVVCLSLIGIIGASAFLPRTQSRSTRYFTTESVLPAIPLIVPSNCTSELYTPNNSYGDPVPVVYTNSPQAISNWLSEHISTSGACVLGFDVESVPEFMLGNASMPSFFEGPATVQLATTHSCLVIHLLRKTGRPSVASAPILEAVLADENIIKAGVGIDQDMMELHRSWGRLEARSRLNLGGIGGGNDLKGLKRLSKAILDVDLPKSKKLACSNWSKLPLSDAQLAYSARDAWAGAAIVQELVSRDPATFAPHRLRDMLKYEQSIEEMNAIAMERKSARAELTKLMEPFRSQGSSTKANRTPEIPEAVRRKASSLRCIIKESAPAKPMILDVSTLGIEIMSKL